VTYGAGDTPAGAPSTPVWGGSRLRRPPAGPAG
jgi:hypothetical protein